MRYQFEFTEYSRRLAIPLITSYGEIKSRQGILIKILDEKGKAGYGEIAPNEQFGSETYFEALEYLESVSRYVGRGITEAVPDNYYCCKFAFDCAMRQIEIDQPSCAQFSVAGLLNSGIQAVKDLELLLQKKYRVFKWKIGVLPFKEEKEIFFSLINQLPTNHFFRLDANGNLSFDEAREWLDLAQAHNVEFLEQPFRKGEEEKLQNLNSPECIALDESICQTHGLNYLKEYIHVIKPCIIGPLEPYLKIRESSPHSVVYSSLLETEIGVQHLLNIAAIDKTPYALGLGGINFFNDGLNISGRNPEIIWNGFNIDFMEQVWSECYHQEEYIV